MKFAKSLIRNQVPEWTQFYIDYKALKKLVKEAAAQASISQKVDDSVTAPFFYAVDRNTELVDTFYNNKFAQYCRRLAHAEERYHEHQHFHDRQLKRLQSGWSGQANYQAHDTCDVEDETVEIEELISVILEIRGKLRKLQWYAEVNKRGFAKILKKFDKKAGTDSQTRYLSSRILILPFANGQAITDRINVANKLLQQLAPAQFGTDELLAGLTLHPTSSNSSVNGTLHSGTSATNAAGHVPTDAEALRRIIDNDDAEDLSSRPAQSIAPRLLVSLLVRAVGAHATKCIPILIDMLTLTGNASLQDPADINQRNVLHRVIIAEGRRRDASSTTQAANEGPDNLRIDVIPIGAHIGHDLYTTDRSSRPGNADLLTAQSLAVLLDHLSEPVRRGVLGSLDQQLRLPLHHAAIYGLSSITKLLVKHGDKNWIHIPDADGQTPLQLAISHRQPVTTRSLLEACPSGSVSSRLMFLPASVDATEVLLALLDWGCDVDYQEPESGESVLHVATKYGNVASVQVLIERKANIEIQENTFGWTPLFLAAVDGSERIAELLIEAGARKDLTDYSGWTAKEHAALRGHISLSQLFPSSTSPSDVTANGERNSLSPVQSVNAGSVPPESSEEIHRAHDESRPGQTDNQPAGIPRSSKQRRSSDDGAIKTFGHRYLADPQETLILVTLGSRDVRLRTTPPVQLDNVPVSEAGQTQLDTALSLTVSATHCTGEPFVVDLPVPELGLATEPIVFHTKEPEKVQIIFDLVPTYSAKRQILGRGVAKGPGPLSASERIQLHQLDATQQIPLLEASSLRVLGMITFETLAVTAFSHPSNGIGHSATYWKSLITTRVIGHRGLGKNTLSKNSLQLGENTVESFIQAANLGASYVEFDVQLTKDLVPVIYHDFVVGDSGFDIPMHSMTLNQFMSIQQPPARGRSVYRTDTSNSSLDDVTLNGKPTSSASTSSDALPSEKTLQHRAKRSVSLHSFNEKIYDETVSRMQHTRDFQAKGYKGNVRGMHIQSKFATLLELFRTLPEGLGFNIECKFPMRDEAAMEEMEESAIEKNLWVDTVLKVIFDNKGTRDVILSSFNPDICILLSLKQPSIPVLFLTESGTTPMMDIRASSLQEAVRFARRWNLLGIVSEATPLIECPRLVSAVKDNGLVCFTYGTGNNVPDFARRQLRAGVDAVIVDSVLAIRRELTEEAAASTNADHDSMADSGDVLAKEVNSYIEQASERIQDRDAN